MQSSRLYPTEGWPGLKVGPTNLHLNQALETDTQRQVIQAPSPEKPTSTFKVWLLPSSSSPCQFPTHIISCTLNAALPRPPPA